MEQLFHFAKTAIIDIYRSEQVFERRTLQVVAVEYLYIAWWNLESIRNITAFHLGFWSAVRKFSDDAFDASPGLNIGFVANFVPCTN